MRRGRRDHRSPGVCDPDDGTVAVVVGLKVVPHRPVVPHLDLDARDIDLFGGRQRATAGIAHLDVEQVPAGRDAAPPPPARSRRASVPTLRAATIVARTVPAPSDTGAAGDRFAGAIAGAVASTGPGSPVTTRVVPVVRRPSPVRSFSTSRRTRPPSGWRHRSTRDGPTPGRRRLAGRSRPGRRT